MAEDFDNHRRIFDRSNVLQAAAAVRAVFDADVEDPFFEEPDDCAGKRAGAAITARSKSKARTPLVFSASMVRFSPKI
jgi:hypothetical protein